MGIKTHYGTINLDSHKRLLENGYVKRLKKIYQDDLPPQLNSNSSKKTRFDHSLGICYLVDFVDASKDDKLKLKAAALVHDAGLPCFGHIGEEILTRLVRIDHEKMGAHLISTTELGDVMEKIGLDKKEIADIFLKKHYLSPLLFGSMDLDNIDNMYMYWESLNHRAHYNPRKLASAFAVENKKVLFDSKYENLIDGWRKTRFELYTDLMNLKRRIKEAMLLHALGIIVEENPDILMENNETALVKMDENPHTRDILRRIRNDSLYPVKVFNMVDYRYDNIREVQKECERQYPNCVVRVSHFKLDRDIIIKTKQGGVLESKRAHKDKLVLGVFEPI